MCKLVTIENSDGAKIEVADIAISQNLSILSLWYGTNNVTISPDSAVWATRITS